MRKLDRKERKLIQKLAKDAEKRHNRVKNHLRERGILKDAKDSVQADEHK